jgi:phenylalanyl-tRNA synthetase beta chain
VSTFPVAKEDVALVVDADLTSEAVRSALASGGGELLESVRLFDVYSGPQVPEGKKSLAFSLRLRAADRTLTETDITTVREGALAAAAELGAALRG